jgi:hypothetical protein
MKSEIDKSMIYPFLPYLALSHFDSFPLAYYALE